MSRVRLAAVAVVAIGAALWTAPASFWGSEDSSDESKGAWSEATCSDWAGRMDDTERWDAAETLLIEAKSVDGTEDDRAPWNGATKQVIRGLDTLCNRGQSDQLLADIVAGLYESDPVLYNL
ncbi:hypothetical protein ACFQ61_09965 [Streptomyces sp. NPDC056500]|uniref:hypothetical protein n=1 Tax=Streptomyces sp. NPDC056500 TaxID=3345840 RepID=UPI0036D11534